MSQEKVAKYKEEKANRKKNMKKEKRAKVIRNTVMTVVLAAVVGWVGYSGVTYYQENKAREVVEADFTAVDDYINALSAE